MPQQTCRNLVQSMRRQRQTVLQARRGHTHYWCSCHASVNVLLKVTSGKMIICYATTLLPHLFWFKDFLLRSQSQWINFFCSPKWTFFNVLFLMLYCWTNHSRELFCWFILSCQSIVVVAMWTSFLRESKFSHRWIPRTKTSDAERWCFLWSTLE